MFLLNTNRLYKGAKRFVSLTVVSSLMLSALCIFSNIDYSNVEETNTDTELITTETGEISRYASDCIITVARAPEENTNDNSSDETDAIEAETTEETSSETEVTDETSPEGETTDETLSDEELLSCNAIESELVVTKIAFTKKDTIKTREDEKPITGHVKVDLADAESFAPSDVVFVSEDPNVAKIDFNYSVSFEKLYYKITPVSGGETFIYAQTEGGEITSERIKVEVKKNQVEKIALEKSCSLKLNESKNLEYVLTPENPRNKALSWTSSNEDVVTVTSTGLIEAVGYGKAKVTATSTNGISASCNVTVSINENEMDLTISTYIESNNHVGNDWYHYVKINGKSFDADWYQDTVTLKKGSTLKFYCESVEDDKIPDVGKKTVKHKVTEKDLINGFTVKVDVYVKENRGRYAGNKAHIVTTFKYTPADEH